MLVYGNIVKSKGDTQSSIYSGMSAVLLNGLRTLYDLGDVVYFESDVDVTQRQLKGLALMSTVQMIRPFSEIKRPSRTHKPLSTDEVKAIISVCNNPLSSTVKS